MKNNLKDVPVLKDLPNLKYLRVSDNQIPDIMYLESAWLVNIEELDFINNPIEIDSDKDLKILLLKLVKCLKLSTFSLNE